MDLDSAACHSGLRDADRAADHGFADRDLRDGDRDFEDGGFADRGDGFADRDFAVDGFADDGFADDGRRRRWRGGSSSQDHDLGLRRDQRLHRVTGRRLAFFGARGGGLPVS